MPDDKLFFGVNSKEFCISLNVGKDMWKARRGWKKECGWAWRRQEAIQVAEAGED